MNSEKEIWKDVVGYEGLYQVSSLGRVKSNWYNRIKYLTLNIDAKNYYNVRLYKNGKGTTFVVQKLVAIAFLNHNPCGYDLIIDHIDGDRKNNRLNNLQLITQRENVTRGKIGIGVHWCNDKGKWKTEILINKVRIFLGRYNDKNKAIAIYNLAVQNISNFNGCRKSFRKTIKSL